jgi:hypothetical protein
MTRDEYEQHLRRLEEQLRVGIELLQASYKHQVGAVELIWRMTNGGGAPAPSLPAAQVPEVVRPPAARARPARRGAGDLYGEVAEIFPTLPEVFDIGHIRQALGSEPHRGSLYRILQELMDEGYLRLESRGSGKTPTRYKKTVPEHAPGVE